MTTKGSRLSRAHRAKIAASLRGHPVSAATRAKLAIAAMGNQSGKGHKVSRLARRKIGAAQKGNHHSLGLKRGSMLARHGVVVLPSPAPGVFGYAPDYRSNRVVFFRP